MTKNGGQGLDTSSFQGITVTIESKRFIKQMLIFYDIFIILLFSVHFKSLQSLVSPKKVSNKLIETIEVQCERPGCQLATSAWGSKPQGSNWHLHGAIGLQLDHSWIKLAGSIPFIIYVASDFL